MKTIDLVCIVDDDPIVVFGTKKIMQNAGFCHQFLIFKNGKEAFEGLSEMISSEKELPDLILLDLNMPVMDGWQFLDEFILIPSHKMIFIYIFTSSINPEDFKRARTYSSVSNYIIKPITVQSLKDAIAVDFQ